MLPYLLLRQLLSVAAVGLSRSINRVGIAVAGGGRAGSLWQRGLFAEEFSVDSYVVKSAGGRSGSGPR